MRVFGNAPKAVVEWAENHGFENVVYDMHIEDVPKEVTKQKTLYIKVSSDKVFRYSDFLSVTSVPIILETRTIAKPYPSKSYLMITDKNEGNIVVDIDTESLILGGKAEIFTDQEKWEDLAQKLSMMMNGYRVLLTHKLLSNSLLNVAVRLEMPDEEELKEKITTLLNLYEPVFQKKIEIEVLKRTAKLEAENRELKDKIKEFERRLQETDRRVINTVKDILKTVGKGWRVVDIDDRLFLYYPEEIKPEKIISYDGVTRLPQDNPFFVRGILMPVDDEVSKVYAIDAFHPNVGPDSHYLAGKKVHEVCLGDLKYSSLTVAATNICDMLKGINLLSAFEGKATQMATGMTHGEEDWEVDVNG